MSAWQIGFKNLIPRHVLDQLDRGTSRVRWESDLGSGRAGPPHFVVAEVGGVVRGFSAFGPSRDEDARSGTGEVFALHVFPGTWGLGIGTALVGESLARLRAGGSTEASLWVIDGNDRARRFYEWQGWQMDGGERERELTAAVFIREVRYRISIDPV